MQTSAGEIPAEVLAEFDRVPKSPVYWWPLEWIAVRLYRFESRSRGGRWRHLCRFVGHLPEPGTSTTGTFWSCARCNRALKGTPR